MRAPCRDALRIGRAGVLRTEPGFYVYAGSALGPGGLEARLAHHIAAAASSRWHIDYLRRRLPIHAIWYTEDSERREHQWAGAMGGSVPLPGFGSSDCACPAHLFYFSAAPSRPAFLARLRRTDPSHPPIHEWQPVAFTIAAGPQPLYHSRPGFPTRGGSSNG